MMCFQQDNEGTKENFYYHLVMSYQGAIHAAIVILLFKKRGLGETLLCCQSYKSSVQTITYKAWLINEFLACTFTVFSSLFDNVLLSTY